MIGMSSFEQMRRFVLVAAWLPGGLLADQITLSGEGRLSGTVSSINDEGVVSLESPLAAEPILLRAEAVRKVTFSEPETVEKLPTSRLELVNGDMLPVSVESLDENEIQVVSPVVGKLTVPRASLKSLLLGIHPSKVLYAGPKSDGDFKAEGAQAANWSFDDGYLSVEGQGRVTRNTHLPKQFALKFTIDWHHMPQFQFYFADPLTPQHQAADRYYFQFNPSGVEIKRESTKGRRYTSITGPLNRRPDRYLENRLKVEIRVDRENAMLYLFLNDEPEGRFKDPLEGVPMGGGLSIVSSAGNDTETRVSHIQVLEWDHDGDRHRTENRGDPADDALIERRGDRFGGRLLSIRQAPGGPVFSFKSDFQDAPIELPESEISAIFFRQDGAAPEAGGNPFALRMRGDGLLRVTSCSFPGDRIEAVHPLLGALVFSKNGVSALERIPEKGRKP